MYVTQAGEGLHEMSADVSGKSQPHMLQTFAKKMAWMGTVKNG